MSLLASNSNSAVHRSKAVTRYVQSTGGRLRLFRIPAYRPCPPIIPAYRPCPPIIRGFFVDSNLAHITST